MASEQTMLKATFAAALVVLVVNSMTLAANWLAYHSRTELFAQVAQLRQRVETLEQAGTELGRRQCTQQ